jgi:hypothetical protein
MFFRRVILALRLVWLVAIGGYLLFLAWWGSWVRSPWPVTQVNATFRETLDALAMTMWLPAALVPVLIPMYRSRVLALVRRHRGVVCMGCAYDLAGADSFGVCPECGRAFVKDQLPRAWARAGFPLSELDVPLRTPHAVGHDAVSHRSHDQGRGAEGGGAARASDGAFRPGYRDLRPNTDPRLAERYEPERTG